MQAVDQRVSVGELAREALIEAGLKLFGHYGYSGVSVRRICDEAGMNVAAINYHFGGKEGLYKAVATYLSDELQSYMQEPILKGLQLLQEQASDRQEAVETLIEIYRAIIKLLVPNSDERAKWARFIVRYQLGVDVPKHELDNALLIKTIGALIGIVRDKPDADQENTVWALTFFGQVLVLRISRKSSLHALGVPEIGDPELALIETNILRNIRTVLEAELAK